jgi:hypothetical protein
VTDLSLFDQDDMARPDAAGPTTAGPVLPFTVSVVRSRRRRKTVGGQLNGTVLTVTVPSWMSRSDESRAVDDMTRRFRWSTELLVRATSVRAPRSALLPLATASARTSWSRSRRFASCVRLLSVRPI